MNNKLNDENIIFYFNEEDKEDKEKDIEKMMYEFEGLDENLDIGEDNNYVFDDKLSIYQEYTTKDLLKICNYYGIDKHIKSSKCKKQDIISTLVYFESLTENTKIVQQRNKMWVYMIEMLNDTKMKQYIIF